MSTANEIPFSEAVAAAKVKIAESIKILNLEPAIVQFFTIVELRPVDQPNVQLRVNTRDGGSNVFLEYNPRWLNRITEPSILAYFFYCEILRIVLHHCTTRRSLPAQSQYLASNLLCFEDTRLLSNWRVEVVEMMKDIPTYEKVERFLKPLGFNKKTDWFLEKLKCALEKAMQKQQQQSKGNGQSQKQKDVETQKPQGNGKSQKESKGNAQQPSQNNEQDSIDPVSDCAKACQEYFDHSEEHAHSQTANWGENSMVDEEIKAIAQQISKNPEMWGHMPGKLQEMIIAANQARFDPTKIVKHFKQEIQSEQFEQSRSKANRRNPDLSGYRHKMKSSIGFFTDVSGSMSDEDVALGQAFMTNFIRHTELWYADWDATCSEITRVKRNPLKNGGMKVTGRGGTDPSCIIKRLKEDKMKLGGIVVFTDNGFHWQRPESKFVNKIFIIGTTNCDEPPSWCRYFLRIDEIREWYDRQF